jgi:hypothetical protein
MGIVGNMLKKKEKPEDMAGAFWKAWTEADELEKIKLVESLTAFEGIGESGMRRSLARLVNSYLEDLYDFVVDTHGRGRDNRYARAEDKAVSQVQP